MNYKIYIEALNNFPIGDWGVSALLGFRERQSNIIFFEDIEEVPVSKMNIVVACIETTNKYFEKLGLPPKKALNIPEVFWKDKEEWLKRDIDIVSLADLKKTNTWPIFVKPAYTSKKFIAGVVKSLKDAEFYFHNLPEDEPLFISEVIDIISEYRAYVIDRKVVGIKHYIGDFYVFPNPSFIEAAVIDYKDAPAGYSMDFGVTKEGNTIIIECNDGWSLGNYGLDNSKYVTLLTKRWLELMKTI